MKILNKILMVILIMGMGFFVTGCSDNGKTQAGFKEPDKISVVTTIYPMYDFVTNIAGDKAEVINLVPAGMEPHDFELSTGDMQLIEQADIFIYNGSGMENFVDKSLAVVSNKDLIVVEASEKVEKLEAHGHTDPHTWLSIDNAMMESERICDAFVKADSKNADYYEANFKAYKEKLETLKADYEKELTGLSKDTIVVAHEAYGYLCKEYNLKQEAVEGLTAESEPDSGRMKEIIDFCKKNDITVIFFEELVSPKVSKTIAEEVGAETMVLNPIGGLTAEQKEENLDYIGLMRENLEALKKALK